MSMLQIGLDEELLARIEQRAARLGKPRSEVIAEALQRELAGGRLREILDSAGGLDRLSEDEAMRLAISELKAVRAQRNAEARD
jgi:metal-responsive CopG/Arc/MetJ family transcriptional regulator